MYAVLRESAGASESEIDAPNLAALLEHARQIYGPLFSNELTRARVALNGETVEASKYQQTVIGPSDEVALLPPVSGGAGKTDEKRLSRAAVVLSAGFSLTVGLVCWLGAGPLAGLTAVAVAASAMVLAGSMSDTNAAGIDGVATAAGSVLFPVAVYFKGEHGLLWAGAGTILLVAPAMIFGGRIFRERIVEAKEGPGGNGSESVRGATARAGRQIWIAFYLGIGLSYLILIRQTEPGLRLLVCLLLMALAYKTASSLAAFPAAGIVAAELAALLALVFVKAPFTLWPMVILGLVVGLACLLGEIGGRMVRSELSGVSLLVICSLDTLLIALPAFYYALRLYLV